MPPESPKLTKAELAAFDAMIAEAQERNDPTPAGLAGAAAKFLAKEFARQGVKELVRKIMGGNPKFAGKLTDEAVTELDKALQEELAKEPTIEELVEIRKSLKIQG